MNQLDREVLILIMLALARLLPEGNRDMARALGDKVAEYQNALAAWTPGEGE